MQLSKYNQRRIQATFDDWNLSTDFSGPIYNYLIHGLAPGSFFTSAFANDFLGAVIRSHPANTTEVMKSIAGWIINHMPYEARGSHAKVENWLKLTSAQRLEILQKSGLVLTSEAEAWAILKGEQLVVS